jgi:outer membrane protein TolC
LSRVGTLAAKVSGALASTLMVALAGVSPASAQTNAPGVRVVTLQEARDLAAQVDPRAVAARSQVEAAEWQHRSAKTDLLTPVVVAGTSYIRFSEPFFNFGTGDISSDATSATLVASYSVLGSGKMAALRRSRAAVASAEASEIAAGYNTALTTDALYFSTLADRELARAAQDRLQRAQEQLGLARVRVLAGEAIASDSLQLMLEVNRAQFAMLSRDSALVVSQLRLGRQIGLSTAATAAPVDSAAPPPLPFTLEAAVAEMLDGGPTVAAARATESSADAGLSAARTGYWPDLDLQATTGAYDSEFFPSAFKRTQIAVNLSIPIWDGGRRELSIAQARAALDVARADRADQERATSEQMAEAYHGYQTGRARIDLAQVGVAAAAENYRVQSVRYREGATTILDILEAQVALTEAEVAVVQARYAAQLSLARIEALLGRRIF